MMRRALTYQGVPAGTGDSTAGGEVGWVLRGWEKRKADSIALLEE